MAGGWAGKVLVGRTPGSRAPADAGPRVSAEACPVRQAPRGGPCAGAETAGAHCPVWRLQSEV